MKRILMPVVAGLLLAVVAAQAAQAAPGGGGGSTTTTFTLSPTQLTFTTPVGAAGLAYVTVTTKSKPVAMGQATSSFFRFIDTGGGSCWTSYGALGQKIPANTSCTIAVSFSANILGTFTGTLSVAECTKWHLSASGGILCDKPATPQTVALSGTSINGIPDLAVLGVVRNTVGPNGPADYRVDVTNPQIALVQPGVMVDGWWSTDDLLSEDDVPAGSGVTTGPIGPVTGAAPVWINAPTPPTPEQLYLIIDLDPYHMVEETNEDNNTRAVLLSAQ